MLKRLMFSTLDEHNNTHRPWVTIKPLILNALFLGTVDTSDLLVETYN